LETVTYGKEGCADRVIAARVAALRKIVNHQFTLEASNWLFPRFAGVWLTDGQLDLMHMHGIEATPLFGKRFDICFRGIGGDTVLGGAQIVDEEAFDRPITATSVARATGRNPKRVRIPAKFLQLTKTDIFVLQNRIRRFTYDGVMTMPGHIQNRLPFIDNKVVEFAYSLPDFLRFDGKIYQKMLLLKFPKFYRTIPWQKTGYPIGIPDSAKRILNLIQRGRRKLSAITGGLVSNSFQTSYDYVNYPDWLRREPARTVFEKLFHNPKAIYPEYLPRSAVELAWKDHLTGANHADELCRYATFEIWLQQAFERKLRTEADALQEFRVSNRHSSSDDRDARA
jgi:asparagine synthase (glutamine-hydrolysing)